MTDKNAAGEAVSETYCTAEQLAGLPGMPASAGHVPRTMERLGVLGRAKPGQGGGEEWPLSSLPQATRLALAAKQLSALPTQHTPPAGVPSSSPADSRATQPPTSAGVSPSLAAVFERRTEKERSAARAALLVVHEYHELLGQGFTWKSLWQPVTQQHGISKATLNRWLGRVRGKPRELWLPLLLDRRGAAPQSKALSAEAWETLKGLYLRLERPSKRACIDRLLRAAKERPDWTVPSRRTLERRLSKLPRALTVFAREGRQAALDLYPPQQRSRAALAALQIINGDGYKHNLWVRFPDGSVVRAKTWFWQDVYSSKILAWRTDQTEHTDVIRLSFGDVLERYGIPDAVLLDNTLAAANKTMSGGIRHRFRFRVREEEPLGIFPLVGSRVMWATPGRGQSKPIERTFGIGGIGEYVDKAPELAGAWTGASPFDRPDQEEYDGKAKAVPLADLERVIAREVAAWNAREGRRGMMHAGGKSCDAVFEGSYQRTPIRRATDWQRRLWLLSSEPVRAGAKDGAITLDAGRVTGERLANRYWSEEMVEHAGRQLVARFDPQRLHEGVHVYTAGGDYVCYAPCIEAAGFADADKARDHARDRNAMVRGIRQLRELEQRMDVRQAAKALAGTDAPVIPAPAAPARGKVVRGEFRDPLERPALPDRPDTPEEAAERAALAEELRGNVAPLREEDDWAPYRRCKAIERRIAAGEPVSDGELAWCRSYQGSTDYPLFQAMAEDFPEKLQEKAG